MLPLCMKILLSYNLFIGGQFIAEIESKIYYICEATLQFVDNLLTIYKNKTSTREIWCDDLKNLCDLGNLRAVAYLPLVIFIRENEC